MRFTMPLSQIGVLSDIYLSGRYGAPIEMVNRADIEIEIDNATKIEPVNGTTSKVTLTIKCTKNCYERFAKEQQPLVVVGNNVFGTSAAPIKAATKINSGNSKLFDFIDITFQAPTALLADAKNIAIKYTFLSSDKYSFQKEISVEDSFAATGIVPLASSDATFQLAISGTAFSSDPTKLKVMVADKDLPVQATTPATAGKDVDLIFISKNLLQLNLKLSAKDLASVSNIMVIQDGKAILLSVELKAQPSPRPDFHQPFPGINQGDSKIVQFKGANFTSLQDLKFEGKTIRFTPKDDGASLDVELTTDVTTLKGTKRLTYTLKDGKSGAIEITVAGTPP